MYTYGKKQKQNTAFSVFNLQFVSIDQKKKILTKTEKEQR